MTTLHDLLGKRLTIPLLNLSLLALLLTAASAAQTPRGNPEFSGFGGEDTARQRATSKVLPTYPAEAVAEGIQGVVEVRIGLDRDGKVGRVKVPPRTHPLLRKAAVVAAREWRFEPVAPHVYTPEGTYHTYRLTFQFTIKDGEGKVGMYDPPYHSGEGVRLREATLVVVATEWTTWEDATDDYKDKDK